MKYVEAIKTVLTTAAPPGTDPSAVKEMLQEIELLEKKAEVTDKILMLKNSAIQVDFCPHDGRTFSGAILSADKTLFLHAIQDARYIEEVLNFLLKHEAEAARLAERDAKAEAPQTNFAPPVEERRQAKTLTEIVAEEVKKQLAALPDGTVVG